MRYKSHLTVEEQDDPDGDSSPSDSESTSSDTLYLSLSEGDCQRHQRQKRSQRKFTWKGSKNSDNAIKPIPLKGYDDAADPRAYHCFVIEGEAYLHDRKVHWEKGIWILAHFLDSKAYDFYVQKVVADDPNNWDLHQFFTELLFSCQSLSVNENVYGEHGARTKSTSVQIYS